ncbi:MAG: AMP-binding protein [Rubrivivax sp.]
MTAASTPSLPLLAPRVPQAPLAWRNGSPIDTATFIAEALHLAESLPARGSPVNLCQDRYHFALALAAALLRGHTSLMPPNALPQTLQRLASGAAAWPVYALCDDDALDTGELLRVPVQRAALQAASRRAAAAPMPRIAADLEAVRLLTSGSTGDPQPHGKRFGALVTNIGAEAEALSQHLGRADLRGLTLVATVPAQHSYGFESTLLLALLGGASFEAGRPFYPADVAAALAAVPEPRALVTTPFHLKTLLRSGVPLPRTALVLSATAPLSPQLAAQAEAALQGVLVEIYGCTEAGQIASRRTTEGERWTTLGALRIERQPPADSACVADEEGAEGVGEVYRVSGGHVAEPTTLADLLELEDPQHFRLMGRANDLIHVGGKRSSLAHLNFHLNRIEGVEDGAFWLPEVDGEDVARPVAFVVAPTLNSAQIAAALRRDIESAFVPRRIVQVAALPREATGKLTAAALRAFAEATLDAPPVASAVAPAAGPAVGPLQQQWTVPPDHPAFDGHFPDHPLLPGAVLLSWVMQTVAEHPPLALLLGPRPRIDSVKFLSPAAPGAKLEMTLVPRGAGVDFDIGRKDSGTDTEPCTVTVARGRIAGGGHST